MPISLDVVQILFKIDDACQNWKEKYNSRGNDSKAAIQNLLYDCSRTLMYLSKSVNNDEQMKQNELNITHIILKLKELRQALNDIWPSDILSFCRDNFNVGQYQVEAVEFFHPVSFYSILTSLVKLYRWSVYDTKGTIVYRYHLERNEFQPGQPYYVLGKSYPYGHAQIQPYGTAPPDYNQMKIHVINDLTGQGPPPTISMSHPYSEF